MATAAAWRLQLRRTAGDLSAAVTGSLVTLPSSIGYGLILFGPLGTDAFSAGLIAVLVAVIIGGAVVGLASSTRNLAVGGTSSVALLLASLVAGTVGQRTGADAIGFGLSMVLATSLMAGVCLLAMARLGAGRLAQLMPYPVVAGITNGSAVLMLLSVYHYAIGDSPGGFDDDWDPGALLVAGAVIALMRLKLPALFSGIPRVLLAVLGGTALHQALLALAGPGFVGPELGALPSPATAAADWLAAIHSLGSLRTAEWLQAALVAGSIAVLAMLETLAATATLNDATGTQSDSQRDLTATATAMIVSGAAAGMAPAGSISSSMTMLRAGAASRLALPLRSIMLAGACLAFSAEIGEIPMAALAGVLISGALGLMDWAALRPAWEALRNGAQHRGDIIGSALVVLCVSGIAVRWSLLSAVAVGLLLALAVFAASMARDVVRRVYANPVGRSRIRRPEADAALLLAEGRRIVVIEVEGAIFFGSADSVSARVQRALRDGARYVILDMRRVSRIDHSGARRLLQACNRFWRDGVWLSLAYVRPGMAVWNYLTELRLMTELDQTHIHPSLDGAIEAAETALLRESGMPADFALTPEAGLRALHIPEAAIAPLLTEMERVSFAAGELVIRAGENAGDVWLLLSGQLDVTLPMAGGDARLSTRLATLAAGSLVGEMALLSGQPRSADVLARTAVECLRFEVATMERLRRDHPELAYHLLAGVCLQVQQNLRQANMTISSLEE